MENTNTKQPTGKQTRPRTNAPNNSCAICHQRGGWGGCGFIAVRSTGRPYCYCDVCEAERKYHGGAAALRAKLDAAGGDYPSRPDSSSGEVAERPVART